MSSAEAIALAALRTRVEPALQAYFPEPVRAQRRRDPSSGVERRANVIVRLAGFRSLAEVRDAFPGGVDPVYQDHGPDWPGIVEDMLGAPVVLRSYGPTAADKRAVAPAQAIRW